MKTITQEMYLGMEFEQGLKQSLPNTLKRMYEQNGTNFVFSQAYGQKMMSKGIKYRNQAREIGEAIGNRLIHQIRVPNPNNHIDPIKTYSDKEVHDFAMEQGKNLGFNHLKKELEKELSNSFLINHIRFKPQTATAI